MNLSCSDSVVPERKVILKILSHINTYKNNFQYYDPTRPWGHDFNKFAFCTISESCSYSGPVVIRKIFRIISPYQHNAVFLLWFDPNPGGHDFNKLAMSEKRLCRFKLFLTQWFLRKRFSKMFSFIHVNNCKTSFPYCGTTRGPHFLFSWFCTMSESSHVNLNFSGLLVVFPILAHVKVVLLHPTPYGHDLKTL
jgi:hypothetical protein